MTNESAADLRFSEFTLVLPTLNEEKTIGKIISYVNRNYKGMKVLVADDGSRDGTKKTVNKIGKRHNEIKFLDRKMKGSEKGLTASVIDGIMLSKTKYAIVMDADLQHPPEKIGDVAKKLSQGSDLVVAVREEVGSWALYRKIISKSLICVGNLILLVGRKATCNDIFSGFFGVDRKLFAEIYMNNKKRFVKNGYKVLFDFLKCNKKGKIKVSEVPYTFATRKYGTSKAGIKQGIALFKSFAT